MSPDLIYESQPDAGADRACWNRAVPGPMRSDLYESHDRMWPERPCGNEACWRHGVRPRRLPSATRLQKSREATTSLIALHQRLQGARR